MVSSRLATIRARQSEKKTSGSERPDRKTAVSEWKYNFSPRHHTGRNWKVFAAKCHRI